MSYQIGIDAINLKPSARLAHTEYLSSDPIRRAVQTGGQRLEDLWDFDFIWNTNDGPVWWGQRGRVTDMGHADFLEGGVDRREPKPCPFNSPEEVWAFDAVKEYGLTDLAELVGFYEKVYQKSQAAQPNQVVTGGYYKTIVSGAIDAFGWDMLLEAASEPAKFEKVLDSFFRLTLHHVQAWAQTTAPVFIQHDDFVWSAGPFIQPAFYRSAIIPRYAELWKVLHAAGKKVLFCADADWSMFVADIADAGADGFIFEPMLPLEGVVEKFGKSHVIMGSKVDCRTLTFGDKDAVRREIDATLKLAKDCPGFFCAVGNHIPANVPVETGLFYMDYLREHWTR